LIESAKEKLLIQNLLSSEDLFAVCRPLLNPSYFSVDNRAAIEFIAGYADKYNSIPALDIIEAETSSVYEIRKLTRDEIEYTKTEFEQFCKHQAIIGVVSESIGLLDTDGAAAAGKIYKMVEDAMMVSLVHNIGIDFFENPEELVRTLKESHSYISSGWPELDKLLGGGFHPGLFVWSGNSGTGKSITLANLGRNLYMMGKHVLYISLELSKEMIADRYVPIITGLPVTDWKEDVADEAVKRMEHIAGNSEGSLVIEYMSSGTNTATIKSYLKAYEIEREHTPDVIIIDYLDLMGSNSGMGGENIFQKDKEASEEIRALGMDYNIPILSASQQNRDAINVIQPNQSHVAGGISKINTSDFWFSILATDDMKANGDIAYLNLKARSSDALGKIANFRWIGETLRIESLNGSVPTDKFEVNFKHKTKDTAIDATVSSSSTFDDAPTLLNAINL
jgi:archaellum biogenesis ATPase FlaH